MAKIGTLEDARRLGIPDVLVIGTPPSRAAGKSEDPTDAQIKASTEPNSPTKPPVPPQAEKTPSGRPLRPLMSLERARALGIPDRVLVIETEPRPRAPASPKSPQPETAPTPPGSGDKTEA